MTRSLFLQTGAEMAKAREDYVNEVRLLRAATEATAHEVQAARIWELRECPDNQDAWGEWKAEADKRWEEYNMEVWINRYAE